MRARRLAVAGRIPNPLIPAAAATAEAEYLRLEHEADPTSWRRASEFWRAIDHHFVAAYCSPRAHEIATRLQLEVLRLVAQGRTNSEIGDLLFISTKTASVHVSHILAKLGVSSRVQAAGLAHDKGLLETP